MMKMSLKEALDDILNRAKWRWECLRHIENYCRDYRALNSRFGEWFLIQFQRASNVNCLHFLVTQNFWNP